MNFGDAGALGATSHYPRTRHHRGTATPSLGAFNTNDRILSHIGTLIAVFAVTLSLGSLAMPEWIVEQDKAATVFNSANMWSVCFNFGKLSGVPSIAELRLTASHFNVSVSSNGSVWVEKPLNWQTNCCNFISDSKCTYLWHFVQDNGFSFNLTLFFCGIVFLNCSVVAIFTLYNGVPELRLLELLRDIHSGMMFCATGFIALGLTGFIDITGDKAIWKPRVPYTDYSTSFFIAMWGALMAFASSVVFWIDHFILSYEIWSLEQGTAQNGMFC